MLLGNADGRIGEGARRILTQADVGEVPETGDHFGWDVALGRAATSSNCAQLLVGSPGEDLGSAVNAGMAHLASSLPADEGTPATDAFTATQADGGGSPESGDEFGSAVGIAGITKADPRRLLIGAPR